MKQQIGFSKQNIYSLYNVTTVQKNTNYRVSCVNITDNTLV